MSSNPGFSKGRLLVVAFEGWNDAGEAASGAVNTLKEQLEVLPILEVEPEDYFDYQFNRPTVALDDNGRRELTWPAVTMYGPVVVEEASVFLLTGSEPSRGWKTFTGEVLDAIEANGIGGIVFLGAMLADVPHTRPISTFVSTENDELRAHFGIERSSYE